MILNSYKIKTYYSIIELESEYSVAKSTISEWVKKLPYTFIVSSKRECAKTLSFFAKKTLQKVLTSKLGISIISKKAKVN